MNLVVFTATWCQPCKQLKPVIEQLAKSRGIYLAFVDIDADPANAKANDVRSVPTVLVVDRGAVVARLSGAISRERLVDALEDT